MTTARSSRPPEGVPKREAGPAGRGPCAARTTSQPFGCSSTSVRSLTARPLTANLSAWVVLGGAELSDDARAAPTRAGTCKPGGARPHRPWRGELPAEACPAQHPQAGVKLHAPAVSVGVSPQRTTEPSAPRGRTRRRANDRLMGTQANRFPFTRGVERGLIDGIRPHLYCPIVGGSVGGTAGRGSRPRRAVPCLLLAPHHSGVAGLPTMNRSGDVGAVGAVGGRALRKNGGSIESISPRASTSTVTADLVGVSVIRSSWRSAGHDATSPRGKRGTDAA